MFKMYFENKNNIALISVHSRLYFSNLETILNLQIG